MPTDEELEDRRQHVAKLREQLAEEQANNAAALAEKGREIEGARLDAEVADLEAQLEAVKAAGKQSKGDTTAESIAEATAKMAEDAEKREAERVAYAEAQAELAKRADDTPPELVGVAPDEVERRKAEAEAVKASANGDTKKKDEGGSN